MHRRSLTALLSTAFVLGCATTSPQMSQPFPGVVGPEPERARLYVLRPSFEAQLRGESPALSVDGRLVAKLEDNSVISLSLEPGVRSIALQPGTLESGRWSKSVAVSAEPGRTYFLAMWLSVSSSRSFTFVPVAGGVLPIAGTSVAAQAVNHEFVTQEQALELLPNMRLILPKVP